MVKQIEIVVGANFGDEGKGLMTDFFCNEFSKKGTVLNVRHNGGAQAGHTVVTPDGKRHVFSHFGAGSFVPHVATYLSEEFILNPMIFCRELDELRRKFGITPRVYINPRCRITTPYEMLINQIVEKSRGDARHGSCGLGINETIERHREIPFYIGALHGNSSITGHLAAILKHIQIHYVPTRLEALGVTDVSAEYAEWLKSDAIIKNWIIQTVEMMNYCTIADDDIITTYDRVVFEGAQGLLLDNDFLAFAPNLTSSKTGSVNPKNILVGIELQDCDIEVCYVSRSYFTRHGAGRFPTECAKQDILAEHITDQTNHYNEFQGNLRYGRFDRELFERATEIDYLYRDCDFANIRYTRAITHLDETDGKIIYPQYETGGFPYGVRYRSYGETRDDVQFLGEIVTENLNKNEVQTTQT